MNSRNARPRELRIRFVREATIVPMKQAFNHATDTVIKALGSPYALLAAVLVIVVWAVTGPIFGFSDTWQLVINTGTTIVTFLMVFVIQNGQNRDSKAVHIKLDELITALEGARNRIALAELESDEEQERDIADLTRKAQRATSDARHSAAQVTEEAEAPSG
jgi:low affinity Fe/Cu permease